MKPVYTAIVNVTGGREGKAVSEDGSLSLNLALPKEMGGPGKAPNPEMLFAAGYGACFESAVRHVARQQKITISESHVVAKVGVGPNEKGGFELAVELDVALPGLDRKVAQELVQVAHEKVCPYSNATRGNVDVKVRLV